MVTLSFVPEVASYTFLTAQIGRKTLGLICMFVIGLDGLIIAILLHVYDSLTEVVEYAIVSLICIFAFGIACSLL